MATRQVIGNRVFITGDGGLNTRSPFDTRSSVGCSVEVPNCYNINEKNLSIAILNCQTAHGNWRDKKRDMPEPTKDCACPSDCFYRRARA